MVDGVGTHAGARALKIGVNASAPAGHARGRRRPLPRAAQRGERNLFVAWCGVVPLLDCRRATGRSSHLRERQTPSEEGDLVRASAAPLAATFAPSHAPPIASRASRAFAAEGEFCERRDLVKTHSTTATMKRSTVSMHPKATSQRSTWTITTRTRGFVQKLTYPTLWIPRFRCARERLEGGKFVGWGIWMAGRPSAHGAGRTIG